MRTHIPNQSVQNIPGQCRSCGTCVRSQAPLNFFRMFRFGTAADSGRGDANGGRGSPSASGGDGDEDGEGRMVPIIIVGIRSIQPGSGTGQEDASIPPFLDALSSFPTPPTSPGDASIIQPPQNGTRFSHRRRASMGGFNFPTSHDGQRQHRANAQDRPRPWSSVTDSPPGPQPPPSTPATTLNLSAGPSGATTPATSTSPPSPTTQSSAPSRRNSFIRRGAGSTLEPTAEEPQAHPRNARPRRLSESDFTRYGAGAPRRRGVVEPDNNPGEGSRSWIIYVLGGSYPENHPILTTPSLFTDSPTYEDMMLLSSILGPAKPPVASEEDVASAPGLFRIHSNAGVLVAEAAEGDESIHLVPGARCLVCLCDFEADEEARKLVKRRLGCRHRRRHRCHAMPTLCCRSAATGETYQRCRRAWPPGCRRPRARRPWQRRPARAAGTARRPGPRPGAAAGRFPYSRPRATASVACAGAQSCCVAAAGRE
ncbi:uncharacterized protein SETTUDRAFT_92429 [Exserohilum turcica Et28A]|uniref:Uncharacterized protein n=1 Tax=Exserohilum turcicum (strain 28A) TaxID=671987 RepID=R0K279_EXST2|nr:uncharacterized protein SETTUDRAFT_92429 [Exserohilum turcica Et28A]EOA83719.1 hypothetical protein SETTUDRAFT_92429 [Exserohilum turcica Et28A]